MSEGIIMLVWVRNSHGKVWMFMDSDWLGYGRLKCVVRVQSVTWVVVVGCPCDWWWVLSCSPSGPSVKGWVTLTFDSSPIKGEGEDGWFIFLPVHCPSPLD